MIGSPSFASATHPFQTQTLGNKKSLVPGSFFSVAGRGALVKARTDRSCMRVCVLRAFREGCGLRRVIYVAAGARTVRWRDKRARFNAELNRIHARSHLRCARDSPHICAEHILIRTSRNACGGFLKGLLFCRF